MLVSALTAALAGDGENISKGSHRVRSPKKVLTTVLRSYSTSDRGNNGVRWTEVTKKGVDTKPGGIADGCLCY